MSGALTVHAVVHAVLPLVLPALLRSVPICVCLQTAACSLPNCVQWPHAHAGRHHPHAQQLPLPLTGHACTDPHDMQKSTWQRTATLTRPLADPLPAKRGCGCKALIGSDCSPADAESSGPRHRSRPCTVVPRKSNTTLLLPTRGTRCGAEAGLGAPAAGHWGDGWHGGTWTTWRDGWGAAARNQASGRGGCGHGPTELHARQCHWSGITVHALCSGDGSPRQDPQPNSVLTRLPGGVEPSFSRVSAVSSILHKQ